jgi:hypothetical protein
MHDNNKPSKVLSDLALERVMRDVLSGGWEISPERAQQELANTDAGQAESGEDTDVT